MEMPVYIFTGFLESGKTTFLQESLEDEEFNNGERTLFLLCEEGEEEFYNKRFAGQNVFIELVKNEKDLTPDYLTALEKKHKPERVLVEYNGMWMLDSFYLNMPDEWMTYQEMMFADSTTFVEYNNNMRQLLVDKLKSAEMLIFNRFKDDYSKIEFHKIVRAINPKTQIVYEFSKERVEFDQIEDPLPFNIESQNIFINDKDFAYWYRDINDDQGKYDGKVVTVKGRSLNGGGLKEDTFIFGRHIMTCCAADIQFGGLACKWEGADKLEHGGWVTITAKIKIQENEVYGEIGPVLYATKLEVSEMPDPEVATF